MPEKKETPPSPPKKQDETQKHAPKQGPAAVPEPHVIQAPPKS
jgi:hypothetical protein